MLSKNRHCSRAAITFLLAISEELSNTATPTRG